MEGECRVTLDAATAGTEARKQAAPGSGPGSRPGSGLTAALLALTLCLAAAATVLLVLGVHSKNPGRDGDTFDVHHTLRQISNTRAAIHLEGEHNPGRKTSVEWKDDVDQSHSRGGLKLQDNEIVIPQNGLYFVYSQASFRTSCGSGDEDEDAPGSMVHLSHTVKRWSSMYGSRDGRDNYHTILHSSRTACQRAAGGGEGSWYSAVYVGAVFDLRRGDRLRTEMPEKMLLQLEEDAGRTFFGVFAL